MENNQFMSGFAAITPEELAERRQLCQVEVTLNGQRASIRGARLKYAIVATYAGNWGAEWAWDTVKRVVANGGNFQM